MRKMQTCKRCVSWCVTMLTVTIYAMAGSWHIVEGALPMAPDYNDTTQWYVQDRHGVADIFYIVSTETDDYQLPDSPIFHFADTYNNDVRAALHGEMVGVDHLLSGSHNFYSPYYRQCTMQAFMADSLVAMRLPLAMEDVSRAFRHYLKHMNQGRPFILAGFSQGAMAVVHLLQEMDSATYDRMIAAYVIGANVPQQLVDTCSRVVPVKGADDTGVTICYNSVRDPGCMLHMLGDDNAIGINPVNWRTDATPATLVTVPSPGHHDDEQQTDTLTVHLDPATKLLLVDGYTGTHYVLPLIGKVGNYHSLELWLYRKELCENMALRTRAYLRKHGMTVTE
ncbi:MAG: DUF3089 domain-containing protein [Muribaculaceae bacterium]|nr:DUF3089 domain-containing protein [Muribaculaceae bacterium]